MGRVGCATDVCDPLQCSQYPSRGAQHLLQTALLLLHDASSMSAAAAAVAMLQQGHWRGDACWQTSRHRHLVPFFKLGPKLESLAPKLQPQASAPPSP